MGRIPNRHLPLERDGTGEDARLLGRTVVGHQHVTRSGDGTGEVDRVVRLNVQEGVLAVEDDGAGEGAARPGPGVPEVGVARAVLHRQLPAVTDGDRRGGVDRRAAQQRQIVGGEGDVTRAEGVGPPEGEVGIRLDHVGNGQFVRDRDKPVKVDRPRTREGDGRVENREIDGRLEGADIDARRAGDLQRAAILGENPIINVGNDAVAGLRAVQRHLAAVQKQVGEDPELHGVVEGGTEDRTVTGIGEGPGVGMVLPRDHRVGGAVTERGGVVGRVRAEGAVPRVPERDQQVMVTRRQGDVLDTGRRPVGGIREDDLAVDRDQRRVVDVLIKTVDPVGGHPPRRAVDKGQLVGRHLLVRRPDVGHHAEVVRNHHRTDPSANPRP